MVRFRGCPGCTGSGFFRTKVNYQNIVNTFRDGQTIGANVNLMMNLHKANARIYAPRRTGRLAREHYFRAIGPKTTPNRDYWIGTTAGYAKFLLGTAQNGKGYIYPKKGDELELRPIPYSGFSKTSPDRFRERVQGQEIHPQAAWLGESLWQTLMEMKIVPKKNAEDFKRQARMRAGLGG